MACPNAELSGAESQGLESWGGTEPSNADEVLVDDAGADLAEIYRTVHESPAFLLWDPLYVVLIASTPQLMAHRVIGPLNTAWLLGLLQFVSTFQLTWFYARHAGDHRDRAALRLRWETQGRLR
jgi:uncharacterized membrane protein (DUF485 family)